MFRERIQSRCASPSLSGESFANLWLRDQKLRRPTDRRWPTSETLPAAVPLSRRNFRKRVLPWNIKTKELALALYGESLPWCEISMGASGFLQYFLEIAAARTAKRRPENSRSAKMIGGLRRDAARSGRIADAGKFALAAGAEINSQTKTAAWRMATEMVLKREQSFFGCPARRGFSEAILQRGMLS